MSYRTLAEPYVFADEPVKGSRFVALAAPVTDEVAFDQVLADARGRWPDATHHCWAWRLRGGAHRSADAGEPGGSAGRPILAQIDGHGVVDVGIVVARWFGGTKLGVGGLIRAYGGCAGRALDRAAVVEVVPTVRLKVVHAYDDTGAVQAVLGAAGLGVADTIYDVEVTRLVDVPEPDAEALVARLVDRTSGRARVERVSGGEAS